MSALWSWTTAAALVKDAIADAFAAVSVEVNIECFSRDLRDQPDVETYLYNPALGSGKDARVSYWNITLRNPERHLEDVSGSLFRCAGTLVADGYYARTDPAALDGVSTASYKTWIDLVTAGVQRYLQMDILSQAYLATWDVTEAIECEVLDDVMLAGHLCHHATILVSVTWWEIETGTH